MGIPEWFETVATLAIGGVVTWCVARINRMGEAAAARNDETRRREEAMEGAVRTLLKCHLLDFYDAYVVGGKRMSVERRSELEECHRAYKGLGGNGTGDELYRQTCRVPVDTFHGERRDERKRDV